MTIVTHLSGMPKAVCGTRKSNVNRSIFLFFFLSALLLFLRLTLKTAVRPAEPAVCSCNC